MEPQRRIEATPEDRSDGAGAGAPRRQGVGEILRLKRESFGQDLPTVAAQLHIRLSYLKAIENGRFKDLPGMAYASGFVRSYADYLSLDGEEMVRRFRAEVAGIGRQVQLSFPSIATEGKIPGGAVLLLSAVFAVLGYGAWYYMADRHKSFVDIVPEVPTQLRSLLGKQAPATDISAAGSGGVASRPATPPVATSGRAAGAPAPDATASASIAGTAPASPPASSGTPPAAAPPPPPPPMPLASSVLVGPGDLAPSPADLTRLIAATAAAAKVDGPPVAAPAAVPKPAAQVVVASPGARVKLIARMDSWVQIYDKTGKSFYSAVLRAGQAIEVPNQPGLLLTTGNVGGLDIVIDGQAQPALGSVGLVKRDLPLDPTALKAAFANVQ
jgi:cytoskeleton protein RodZ